MFAYSPLIPTKRCETHRKAGSAECTGRQRNAPDAVWWFPKRQDVLLTRNVVMRALKAPQSRHAILRFRFNAIKASIVMDTFPKGHVHLLSWRQLHPETRQTGLQNWRMVRKSGLAGWMTKDVQKDSRHGIRHDLPERMLTDSARF